MAYLLFMIGAFLGSFLNVIVDRVPHGQSIIYPPSHCSRCKHKLAWYDLVPLFSYLTLGGTCRYCHRHISFYYPVIELVTGLLFVAIFFFALAAGYIYVIYLLLITCLFIVIFFTDLKYGLISVYTLGIGCLIIGIYHMLTNSTSLLLPAGIAGSIASFFFYLLYLATKKRGMGLGDVLLVFFLGLFLGFPHIAIALYVAFLSGAFVSIMLIANRRKRLKHDTIPFGPFLIFGTYVALFWGDAISEYVKTYLLL